MNKKENLYSKILDFYLYSSTHIAFASFCFVFETYLLLDLKLDLEYFLFIFSGTLFLYVLHNFMGDKYFVPEIIREKMIIISKMKKYLFFTLLVSISILIYSFFHLHFDEILYLSIMGFISIWYVLPIFGNKKRLRDYSFIKIFLIALVWAFLATIIPLLESDISFKIKVIIFLEKYLFIFALTIPFDIRDYDYEKKQGLKTLPSILGKTKSILLAISFLFIDILIVLILRNIYGIRNSLALISGYILTIIAVKFSTNKKNDYYFTGLLDGMIIINLILILIFKYI